jgi:hypothetical protein
MDKKVLYHFHQVNTNIGNSGNMQMAMGMASNGRTLFDLQSLRTRLVFFYWIEKQKPFF